MNQSQEASIIAEVNASVTRSSEMRDALEARKGYAYMRAVEYVADTTTALAMQAGIVASAIPDFALINKVALDSIGPDTLEIATLLAYAPENLRTDSPEFKSRVSELAAEVGPLLHERQRVQHRAQAIMKESP